jgi:ATP-dependent DNA helicase
MMEKQISKKKLERMAILGGDFRKAGSRSKGEFKTEAMNELLESDVKDLQSKGTDVESIRIADDKEFERIMKRDCLFGEGEDAISTEGKMCMM